METSSPLFKGATRPACVGGVPLKVFVLNIGVIALLAIWIWIPLMLIAPFTHLYLKMLADKDEQIFSQLLSYIRINLLQTKNRKFWGNVTSLSPKQEKKPLAVYSLFGGYCARRGDLPRWGFDCDSKDLRKSI